MIDITTLCNISIIGLNSVRLTTGFLQLARRIKVFFLSDWKRFPMEPFARFSSP